MGIVMAKRLTIREQQAIAAKNKKSSPSAEIESTTPEATPESISAAASEVESTPETHIRDKQVNVKFTTDDLSRLKKAAKESHRPVANYIYSAIMDKISGDGY